MSIHAQLSPQAQARLRAQQRNSAITSIIISILSVVLLGILLLWLLLPTVETFTPEIVSYQSSTEEEQQATKPKINRAVERKPSAPSSQMARVIAANTTSLTAVPIPDIQTPDPSMDFGDGDDFGDGWGDDDMGTGVSTTFFGQEVKGERILYVIDYSLSMKGERERLMRAELAKSVMQLPAGKQYQMIYFAGPAWVATDKVKMKGQLGFVATGGDGEQYEWTTKNRIYGWKPIGEGHIPSWLDATDSNIYQSEALIKKTQLIIGTDWEPPMAMAFKMDPLPNIIVFMTDGSAPGDPVSVAKDIASRAKKERIVINTIALMQPKAAEAMETLAKKTGGVFSLINENGEKVDPDSIKPAKGAAKKRKK